MLLCGRELGVSGLRLDIAGKLSATLGHLVARGLILAITSTIGRAVKMM